jgi:agmatinase
MTRPFDPDAAAVGGGLYGLPHTPEEAEGIIIPVPWEATVSHGIGTARGPDVIHRASPQLDLLDREFGRAYERGIAMLPVPEEILIKGTAARRLAEPVIRAGQPGEDAALARAAGRVNDLCQEMNDWVETTSRSWLEKGKLVGVVGGDHSVPFGIIQAVANRHPGVGVLHVDAHADLREAYEGFTWSHASIMYNVIHRIPEVARIVQVGLRDVAPGEDAMIRETPDRLRAFFEWDNRNRLMEGESWKDLVEEIVATLPDEVYISFDIDGLDPSLCPHTGTPVPGGLSYHEATWLIGAVVRSGRRIVGFDLVEVAPDPTGRSDYDGNVGARILYQMIGWGFSGR